MKSQLAALLTVAVMAFSPTAFAGGKKENKLSVTFHLEADATDDPKMIAPQMANGKKRFFYRLPEISTKDIIAFSPFPADVGEGYGVVFRVKGNVANRLSALTNANVGRFMISQINGRVLDGFMIDKQVNDGCVVIWKGVTLAEVGMLDAEMPRFGAKEKKHK